MFIVSHSANLVDCNKEIIWDLWSDVNNWSKWDNGLESSRLITTFKTGGKASLTPKGGSEVDIIFKEIVKNKSFSDESDIGLAVIKTDHIMQEYENGIKIIHKITIIPRGEKGQEFVSKVLWPNIYEGLADSVEKLAELAESISKSIVR